MILKSYQWKIQESFLKAKAWWRLVISRHILPNRLIYAVVNDCMYKGKGKVHPRTGHEGPEGEKRYRSILPATSALDVGGWPTPRPDRYTPGKEIPYPLYRGLGGCMYMCVCIYIYRYTHTCTYTNILEWRSVISVNKKVIALNN